ncbi:MAG: hypothetical protein IPK28_04805 [Devosia sp.]|nr:hypothetical protein [Devosia sp.]
MKGNGSRRKRDVADAQFNLVHVNNCEGVPQDYTEAANGIGSPPTGDARAQVNLGDMYHKGQARRRTVPRR